MIRDPEEESEETDNPSNGKFLRIPKLSAPIVHTTPPTPTMSTEIDDIEPPKRRRTESPRNFRRQTSGISSSGKVTLIQMRKKFCHLLNLYISLHVRRGRNSQQTNRNLDPKC